MFYITTTHWLLCILPGHSRHQNCIYGGIFLKSLFLWTPRGCGWCFLTCCSWNLNTRRWNCLGVADLAWHLWVVDGTGIWLELHGIRHLWVIVSTRVRIVGVLNSTGCWVVHLKKSNIQQRYNPHHWRKQKCWYINSIQRFSYGLHMKYKHRSRT